MNAGITVVPALVGGTAPAWGSPVAGAPATAAMRDPRSGGAHRTRADMRPPVQREAGAHSILSWLMVAQLRAINRAKLHQLQALLATTRELT